MTASRFVHVINSSHFCVQQDWARVKFICFFFGSYYVFFGFIVQVFVSGVFREVFSGVFRGGGGERFLGCFWRVFWWVREGGRFWVFRERGSGCFRVEFRVFSSGGFGCFGWGVPGVCVGGWVRVVSNQVRIESARQHARCETARCPKCFEMMLGLRCADVHECT